MTEHDLGAPPSVRAAAIADMDAVADIYTHYVEHSVATFDVRPRTVDAWRMRLKQAEEAGHPFLVAEVGGQIAGYAMVGPWKPKAAYRHCVEDSVYLAPAHAGRGLGRLLMESLADACAQTGIRQIVAVIADTEDGNQGAGSVALHAKLGFATIGRMPRVGYKHGMWVDTVIMQRSLD